MNYDLPGLAEENDTGRPNVTHIVWRCPLKGLLWLMSTAENKTERTQEWDLKDVIVGIILNGKYNIFMNVETQISRYTLK